ncbi:hypothetical protein LEP1GSC137_1192 [Leptospira borgpetersenii str. Noumea 25]|uniref:Uncharacterized protein n=1 Tax=Leptospira borgpetersenii serovar Ballum TaxID=280505 RepID=A0A0S2IWH6_LEPBO|nr:hypothetical protein LBBP_03722 [Leptospira borgpetersenii serovar Ballum]EKR00166.1 hypothetical protein LEP1GSC121_3613 [Leptospira borgpetersenii serovar Castellonis str. 200801910]EMO07762.1 hypothetical protein LEP1GSC137_1192 [Leptospira borgpetersenii str. Noumea 25]
MEFFNNSNFLEFNSRKLESPIRYVHSPLRKPNEFTVSFSV